MPSPAKNLERLAVVLRPTIQQLAEQIDRTFGNQVVNWSIFGDTATGVFDADRHTVRNVLVLQQVDLDGVRTLAKLGDQFGLRRIVAPLILTPAFIAKSLDTFPLELLEIQQQAVSILGESPFVNLQFTDPNVRSQCEREMKTVIIALQQGLLSTHGKSQQFPGVILNVVERLSRTLRAMLWLQGRRAFQPLLDVVTSVETLAGRRLPGVRQAVQNVRSPDWNTFQQLYAEVETLGAMVDGW